MKVVDAHTGLTFEFRTHKQKEQFFNLWDKYEIVKETKHENTLVQE